MRNINIKELAKSLNLSTSTVSRAFRESSDINKETKDKILAAAKELNYQPNHYASNLREQRSKTIAVIFQLIISIKAKTIIIFKKSLTIINKP